VVVKAEGGGRKEQDREGEGGDRGAHDDRPGAEVRGDEAAPEQARSAIRVDGELLEGESQRERHEQHDAEPRQHEEHECEQELRGGEGAPWLAGSAGR
jgi:hypothetical protein